MKKLLLKAKAIGMATVATALVGGSIVMVTQGPPELPPHVDPSEFSIEDIAKPAKVRRADYQGRRAIGQAEGAPAWGYTAYFHLNAHGMSPEERVEAQTAFRCWYDGQPYTRAQRAYCFLARAGGGWQVGEHEWLAYTILSEDDFCLLKGYAKLDPQLTFIGTRWKDLQLRAKLCDRFYGVGCTADSPPVVFAGVTP